jgi:AcrR family transcriptional regulator
MSAQLDARAKRSQLALLKAGLELLNKNPEASISDIAAHAGVGRATLYRRYETRENLISSIAVNCLQTINEVTAPIEQTATTTMEAIQMLFELAMPLTQEFQFLINLDQFIEKDPKIAAINEKQKNDMIALVEYGKKKGEINKSLPTNWILHLIDGLFYIGWQQQKEDNSSPKEAAKLAFATFCNGVSNH